MTSTEAAKARPGAIISPVVDLLLVGGLSLIVFVPLLVSGRTDLVVIGAGAQALIAGVVNMPHFMASYRIDYRDRASIMKHKWASIYVPAILIAYIALALWEAQYSPALVIGLVTVGGTYLAWHYTGQVWGMMASFAYLEGVSFQKDERLLIRTGLRILLVWHLSWFMFTEMRDPSRVEALYKIVSAGTVVAFLLGATGLYRLKRRTGKTPPLRAIVAWLAIFVWYAMMARDPKAIFWIQMAHAIQYLAFPVRVEMNRTQRGKLVGHMVLYAVLLLAASIAVTLVVPKALMGVVGSLFGEEPNRSASILVLMFVNIHHYFTDGVIWKISNPEVRRELFAHVPRPEKTAPAVAAPAGAVPSGKRPSKASR
jgi:hypothetical protein